MPPANRNSAHYGTTRGEDVTPCSLHTRGGEADAEDVELARAGWTFRPLACLPGEIRQFQVQRDPPLKRLIE
jgi:hypothetical protein